MSSAERTIKIDARTVRKLVRQALRSEIVLTPPEERRIELAFVEALAKKLAAPMVKAPCWRPDGGSMLVRGC